MPTPTPTPTPTVETDLADATELAPRSDISRDPTDRLTIDDLSGPTMSEATEPLEADDLCGDTNVVSSRDQLRRVCDVDAPTNRLSAAAAARLLQPTPSTGLVAKPTTKPARRDPTKPPTKPPPTPPPRDRRFATGTIDGHPPVPRMLGAYKVTGLLASGGMGVVYRGEHPTLRRPVAIKAMHGQLQNNPAIVGRFFAESVATARVIHPNVVRFFDFGYDARGSAYLVMELLDGETLTNRLTRERRLDVAMALDIAIQIGRGLEAAHENGVVHRDVKPDNIFLCLDPANPGAITVKLLDFGVAKVEGQGAMRTWQGDLLGTPAYMAPEQGLSASDSDARSDLYSVGCILFEMLCGMVPFAGNLVETLVAHQASARPNARALNPRIPPELDALIDRLFAREPAERPQSVTDMVRELTAIEANLSGATLARASVARASAARAPLARGSTQRIVAPGAPSWRRGRMMAGLISVALAIGIAAGILASL